MIRLFLERAAIVAQNPIIEIDKSLALESGGPPRVAEAGTLEEVQRAHILLARISQMIVISDSLE